jgi:hypothetical protein
VPHRTVWRWFLQNSSAPGPRRCDAAVFVHDDHVGEGARGIDGYPIVHEPSLLLKRPLRRRSRASHALFTRKIRAYGPDWCIYDTILWSEYRYGVDYSNVGAFRGALTVVIVRIFSVEALDRMPSSQ